MTDRPRPSQLSKDVAHAMNLFAHPMAGFAAASAVGFGLATQAWGFWAGTVLGAMESAGRLGRDAGRAGEKREMVAAVKARAAAVSLMAEAQSLAHEVARPVAPVPNPVQQPVERARRVRLAAAKRASDARPVAGSGAPAAASSSKPDDLKRIPGIGPKLEQVLQGLGVSTYAQIAGWGEADIAWIEDQLGLSGRVARDGWVAEAKKLSRPRGK